jgi:hypothetical protein
MRVPLLACPAVDALINPALLDKPAVAHFINLNLDNRELPLNKTAALGPAKTPRFAVLRLDVLRVDQCPPRR